MTAALPERAEVPAAILNALRACCLALPEAYEEPAWAGIRWCVRKKNFAHVVRIEDGWPPAYARAVGHDGPLTVLTFRSAEPEPYERGDAGPRFFKPVWFGDVAGTVLDDDTDWDEIADLVTESYCVLAPKKLVDRVTPPPG